MRTENIFVIWSYIRIKAEVRENKTGLSSPPHPSPPVVFLELHILFNAVNLAFYLVYSYSFADIVPDN